MSTRLESAGVRAHVAGLLRAYATEFNRLARSVQRRVEVDPVHDLRVLTRRIRSAVWVARHLAPDYQFRLLRGELRAIGRTLGRRRLLDVAREDAAEYGLDGARLDRRRAREGAALAQVLADVDRAAIVAGLREAARVVLRAREDRLAGALENGILRLRSALAGAARGPEELHELRIQAKKTRYLLEALGRRGNYLRELQRRIGRAHDLQVLQELYRPDARIGRQESRERSAAHRIMQRVVDRALADVRDCILALKGQPPEEPAAPRARKAEAPSEPLPEPGPAPAPEAAERPSS